MMDTVVDLALYRDLALLSEKNSKTKKLIFLDVSPASTDVHTILQHLVPRHQKRVGFRDGTCPRENCVPHPALSATCL
jgi:hypothetical protein